MIVAAHEVILGFLLLVEHLPPVIVECNDPARRHAVEGWFARLTRQHLKRGVFTSIVELQTATNRFIADANDTPKPFVWTRSADAILAAVRRVRQALAGCGKSRPIGRDIGL